MSGEYTRKLFSRRERGCGNKIIFESSSLDICQHVNKALQLVTLMDRGAMTPNEVREYLGLPPVNGGDEALLAKIQELLTEGSGTDENN